jgi:hypothetical protein
VGKRKLGHAAWEHRTRGRGCHVRVVHHLLPGPSSIYLPWLDPIHSVVVLPSCNSHHLEHISKSGLDPFSHISYTSMDTHTKYNPMSCYATTHTTPALPDQATAQSHTVASQCTSTAHPAPAIPLSYFISNLSHIMHAPFSPVSSTPDHTSLRCSTCSPSRDEPNSHPHTCPGASTAAVRTAGPARPGAQFGISVPAFRVRRLRSR